MAVGLLAPDKDEGFESEAFTRQFVMDKLYALNERLRDVTDSNMAGLRVEILGFIDEWLRTLVELDELTCTGAGCVLCAKKGW